MKLRTMRRNGAVLCLSAAGLLLAGSAAAQTPPAQPPPAPAPPPKKDEAPPPKAEAPPKVEERPVVPSTDSSSAGKSRLQEDSGDAAAPPSPPEGGATGSSGPPPTDAAVPGDPSWQMEGEGEGPGPEEEEPPVEEPVEGDEAAEDAAAEPEEPVRFAVPPPSEPLFEPPPDYDEVPYTHHQLRWDVQAGLRSSWIRTSALDPFAESDGLVQLSLGFGRGIFRSGPWSLAALGVWEVGSTSAKARSEDASYSLQRFALALEGRYHVRHWLYGYGRVAPGALRSVARLEAVGQSFSYEARTWLVSADAALGGAARLAGNPDGRSPGARLWAFLEGGYGWSATQDLSLSATAGAPERAQARELGELTLAGPYGRAGLILAF